MRTMRAYNFNCAYFHLSILRSIAWLLGYTTRWEVEDNKVILDIKGTYGWKIEKRYGKCTRLMTLRKIAFLREFREVEHGEGDILAEIINVMDDQDVCYLNFSPTEKEIDIRRRLLDLFNYIESIHGLLRRTLKDVAEAQAGSYVGRIQFTTCWNYLPAKIFGVRMGEEDTLKTFIEQEINQRSNLTGERWWMRQPMVYFDQENNTRHILSLYASLKFLKTNDYPTYSLWIVPPEKKFLFESLHPSREIIKEAKECKKEMIKEMDIETLGLWVGDDVAEMLKNLGYTKVDGILLKDLIDDNEEPKFYIDKLQ